MSQKYINALYIITKLFCHNTISLTHLITNFLAWEEVHLLWMQCIFVLYVLWGINVVKDCRTLWTNELFTFVMNSCMKVKIFSSNIFFANRASLVCFYVLMVFFLVYYHFLLAQFLRTTFITIKLLTPMFKTNVFF